MTRKENRPWLLKSVNYPTGMKTTFLYNQEADKKNAKVSGLPTGINGALIPVVTEQITTYKQNTTPSKNGLVLLYRVRQAKNAQFYRLSKWWNYNTRKR